MTVSAIVVSHGHAREVARLVPLLRPQVDELVLIENVPGSVGPDVADATVLRDAPPVSFASNVNRGIAATHGDFVLVANPDTVPEPDAVATLREFLQLSPRAGIAGPRLRWPDGRWQPSRRRFPTVRGTLVRRTPLRLVFGAYTQRAHYMLDDDVSEPAQADWLLGAFVLMRRTMLEEIGGWDGAFRHYGEDIDLCYRASKAGWERWYVPAAVVTHDYAAVIDGRFLTRHTWWHLRGMLRFVRKHPERLRAL